MAAAVGGVSPGGVPFVPGAGIKAGPPAAAAAAVEVSKLDIWFGSMFDDKDELSFDFLEKMSKSDDDNLAEFASSMLLVARSELVGVPDIQGIVHNVIETKEEMARREKEGDAGAGAVDLTGIFNPVSKLPGSVKNVIAAVIVDYSLAGFGRLFKSEDDFDLDQGRKDLEDRELAQHLQRKNVNLTRVLDQPRGRIRNTGVGLKCIPDGDLVEDGGSLLCGFIAAAAAMGQTTADLTKMYDFVNLTLEERKRCDVEKSSNLDEFQRFIGYKLYEQHRQNSSLLLADVKERMFVEMERSWKQETKSELTSQQKKELERIVNFEFKRLEDARNIDRQLISILLQKFNFNTQFVTDTCVESPHIVSEENPLVQIYYLPGGGHFEAVRNGSKGYPKNPVSRL
jgi:hypothetical protein